MSIEKIFPTQNDVGGLTKGRQYSEANMKDLIGKQCNHSFIVSGFTVSNPSGLTLRVAVGKAVIEGYVVQENAQQDISASASQAGYHLWLVLRDTDQDGLVDDFIYQGTTTETPPSGATIVGTLLLAIAETSGSAVTKLWSWGASSPGLVTGWYSGNNNDNRLITLPITPKFVVISNDFIYSQSGPVVPHANGFTHPLSTGGQVGLVHFFDNSITVTAEEKKWVVFGSFDRGDRPQCVAGGFYVSHTTSIAPISLNETGNVYNYVAWA